MSGNSSNFKVTPTEIYGFMVWMLSAIFAVTFTVWAWVPDSYLNDMGFFYLPNKYYVIALPNWLALTFVIYNLGQDA